MSDFRLPPMGYGPGSQLPQDEERLDYMVLPEDMRTFTAHLPEVDDLTGLEPAMALMAQVADAADRAAQSGAPERFDLSGLDRANRALVAETMGEGEVAMKLRGVPAIAAQESVFAGIWVLSGAGLDAIEVGAVPQDARTRAFVPRRAGRDVEPDRSVASAPALMEELAHKSAAYAGDLHVINLSLLPHSEGDLIWLDTRLGEGSTDILSRGYGNCRVRATALPHVWRVQFFNSMDQLILDSFEVTDMPEVAIAAPEDLGDSAGRLREVLEAIR